MDSWIRMCSIIGSASLMIHYDLIDNPFVNSLFNWIRKFFVKSIVEKKAKSQLNSIIRPINSIMEIHLAPQFAHWSTWVLDTITLGTITSTGQDITYMEYKANFFSFSWTGYEDHKFTILKSFMAKISIANTFNKHI